MTILSLKVNNIYQYTDVPTVKLYVNIKYCAYMKKYTQVMMVKSFEGVLRRGYTFFECIKQNNKIVFVENCYRVVNIPVYSFSRLF